MTNDIIDFSFLPPNKFQFFPLLKVTMTIIVFSDTFLGALPTSQESFPHPSPPPPPPPPQYPPPPLCFNQGVLIKLILSD